VSNHTSPRDRVNSTSVIVTNEASGLLEKDGKSLAVITQGDSIDTWRQANNQLVEFSSVDMNGTLIVDGRIVQQQRLPSIDLPNM
jgi:hypothetical protein